MSEWCQRGGGGVGWTRDILKAELVEFAGELGVRERNLRLVASGTEREQETLIERWKARRGRFLCCCWCVWRGGVGSSGHKLEGPVRQSHRESES